MTPALVLPRKDPQALCPARPRPSRKKPSHLHASPSLAQQQPAAGLLPRPTATCSQPAPIPTGTCYPPSPRTWRNLLQPVNRSPGYRVPGTHSPARSPQETKQEVTPVNLTALLGTSSRSQFSRCAPNKKSPRPNAARIAASPPSRRSPFVTRRTPPQPTIASRQSSQSPIANRLNRQSPIVNRQSSAAPALVPAQTPREELLPRSTAHPPAAPTSATLRLKARTAP